MLRLPYGISNFETLVNRGAYYVDRTNYIEQIEDLVESYLFFLRPRRFGKSLWVSVLQYYYGIEHKNKFEGLFQPYYIGKHPTPLANSYLVLKFDFSGIDTTSKEHTYQGFFAKVKKGILEFMKVYAAYFSPEEKKDTLAQPTPEIMIDRLFTHAHAVDIPKIYVIIDEYDHFTNELISFRLEEFKEITGAEGMIELKFLHKKDADKAEVVAAQGRKQLKPIYRQRKCKNLKTYGLGCGYF